MFKKILILFILSFIIISSAHASGTIDQTQFNCKYESVHNLKYSPDRTSFAFAVKKHNGNMAIVRDGVESKEYTTSWFGKYSPDSSSFAFETEKGNGNVVMVKDGIESEEYADIRGYFYSPDSKSLLFEAEKDNGETVVIKDGVESDIYSGESIAYSSDGNSFAYVSKKDNGKYVVVKDGIESKQYESIGSLKYSPDNKIFAFIASTENKSWDSGMLVVENGVESKEYRKISSLFYSPDSTELSFIAQINNLEEYYSTNILVTNGVEKSEEYIFGEYYSRPYYSPKGDSFGFMARKKNGKYIIIKDGVESNEYLEIDGFIYSNNGKSSAFFAKKDNGSWVLVKDGIESNEYVSLLSDAPYYSPNGINIVFAAVKSNGKYVVVKDGIESKEYDKIRNPFPISFSRYSSDGKSFTFFAQDDSGKYVIVKDGVELKETYFSIQRLAYSPNTRDLVIHYTEEDGKEFILKDGNKSLIPGKTMGWQSGYVSGTNNFFINTSINGKSTFIVNGIDLRGCKKTTTFLPPTIVIPEVPEFLDLKPRYSKQLILAKINLEKNPKQKKYISQVDKIVENLPKDKLQELAERLSNIDSNNFKKYEDLLNYLEAKIMLELGSRTEK